MDRFDSIPYEELSAETTWTTLGKGSFGSVFCGNYLGLEIAIKEINPSQEYDVSKYFERETKILQECRHPNIVQYLGLCIAPPAPTETDPTKSRVLIISEYIASGNLRSYIWHKEKPFPWRLRLSFAIDITRALAYLHARNCMHRDLKGENILITSNERCKLTDFGFARIIGRNEIEKNRQTSCGTDGYMAPEIVTGETFSLPVDIYSLGIIFAEVLSRRLVDGDTFVRLIPSFGIDHDEIRHLASPDCPNSFIELTIACTETDPTKRPIIKAVLESLKSIEVEVLEMEAARAPKGQGTLSVGSIGYAGIKNGKSRPKAPRLPSFGISTTATTDPATSGKDEITPNKPYATESDSDGEEDEDFVETISVYSTSVVRRGDPLSTLSSTLTVRAVDENHNRSPSSSLPSLPPSWMKHFAEKSNQTVPSTLDTISSTELFPATPEDIFHSAILIPSTNPGTQLHRFSLMKPGWRLFGPPVNGIDLYAKKVIRRSTSQTEDSGGLFNKSKCQLCEKKFGMLKAYLECDDCGYRCHLACSQAVEPTCTFEELPASSLPPPTRSLPPLPPPSAASSKMNPSKLKKKRVGV